MELKFFLFKFFIDVYDLFISFIREISLDSRLEIILLFTVLALGIGENLGILKQRSQKTLKSRLFFSRKSIRITFFPSSI